MSKLRCLIVDDEPGVVQALRRLLAMWGHDTRTAGDGREALALLEHESFDLILLDQRMPGLTGVETWARIRARGGVVPVAVLVTAAIEGESLAESNGMGFLAKPFDVESLEATLERALRSRDTE